MPLESATYVSELVATNPAGSDAAATSDDHHRLIKSVLQNTFPNANGAITPTPAQFNALASLGNNFALASNSSGIVVASTLTKQRLEEVASYVGMVASFAGNTAPSGWLACDGSAVSRTTYADLFAYIGETYGAGDGSTTFNLPDLRGEFVRGWDNGRGVDASRAFGSRQLDQNRSHTHTGTTDAAGGHNHSVAGYSVAQYFGGGGAYAVSPTYADTVSVNTSTAADHTHTFTTDADGGAETRPRNVALLFCIKY